jgi:hypothetical protein
MIEEPVRQAIEALRSTRRYCSDKFRVAAHRACQRFASLSTSALSPAAGDAVMAVSAQPDFGESMRMPLLRWGDGVHQL